MITKIQSLSLFTLRVLIGWHLLYEGLAKVFDPSWTSEGYLLQSKWIFSGFFKWIVDNNTLLLITDSLNQWGLVLIGLCLMLGLFTRTAAIAGMVLLLMYYLCLPPLNGIEYAIPMEGNNMIVNKTLIEAAALLLLAVFPSGKQYGLDLLRNSKRK